MRVAQLAPLWKTVPPAKYGGTELVVSSITEGLYKRNVDVTLFACAGSRTSAKLIPIIDKPMYDLVGGFSWNVIQPYEFLLYDALFDRLNSFDIIHNHIGLHPLVFSKLLHVPMVTTLHSSAPPDFPDIVSRVKDNNFISISNAQRSIIPHLHYVDTIYHGIETNRYKYNESSHTSYLLFVGSLTKNKGIDIAVKAASELHEPLIIAGEVRKSDEQFLKENVYPYVDGKIIKFIGEVDFQQKNELYMNAKALLFPIRWNEAFGLVMVEALACGTPVIAYRNGSVPEIIRDGETGIIVDSFEEFKKAITSVSQISRTMCRADAVQRFDQMTMVDHYIDTYSKLLNK